MSIEIKTGPFRYHKRAYALVIAAWASYIMLIIFAPRTGSRNQLGLSSLQGILIILSIIVLLLVIWLVALRGAEIFKSYARRIGHQGEGKALALLANGLFLTLGYLILNQLLISSMAYFINTPYLAVAVLFRDHLPVLATLAAFGTLYLGSHELKKSASIKTWTPSTLMVLALYCMVAFAMVYIFMSQERVTTSKVPVYSLPRPVLLYTLLVPYLVGWFLGLLAALNIAKYARVVKGIIYRKALRDLAWGIVAVVTFAVTYQLLSLLNRFLLGLGLELILLILYGLLTLYALGFWLVRSGAKKLMHLEVVQ